MTCLVSPISAIAQRTPTQGPQLYMWHVETCDDCRLFGVFLVITFSIPLLSSTIVQGTQNMPCHHFFNTFAFFYHSARNAKHDMVLTLCWLIPLVVLQFLLLYVLCSNLFLLIMLYILVLTIDDPIMWEVYQHIIELTMIFIIAQQVMVQIYTQSTMILLGWTVTLSTVQQNLRVV